MGHSKKKRLQRKSANQGGEPVQGDSPAGQATVSTREAGASQQDPVDTRATAPSRWSLFKHWQCPCRLCGGQTRRWHQMGILLSHAGLLPLPRTQQTWDALEDFARNRDCFSLLDDRAPSINSLQPRQLWTHEEWLTFKSAMEAKAAALTSPIEP